MVTPQSGATAGAPGDDARMAADLEAMKSFEREVLAALERLDIEHLPTVDAVPGKFVPAHFGAGFPEAQMMFAKSVEVTENIRGFARALRAQIEAMALTIRMATDTTAATEEENKRKLAALLQETASLPPLPGTATPVNAPVNAPPAGQPAPAGPAMPSAGV